MRRSFEERWARASFSVVIIPRVVTAADSAAARKRRRSQLRDEIIEGRQVRGRRQTRVRRHRVRRQWRGPRQRRKEPLRRRIREGRRRAQGRRDLSARSVAVRVHISSASTSTRATRCRCTTFSIPHPAERFGRRRASIARPTRCRAWRQPSEQGAKLDTRGASNSGSRSRSSGVRGRTRASERSDRAERERVGVRRR